MTKKHVPRVRKPRTDGLRNRELLLLTAKAAFIEQGVDIPPVDIARRAGVGVGTLYRHFPTRDELVEAVFAYDVEQLTQAAHSLLKDHSADEALALWLGEIISYVAAKRVIAPVLYANVGTRAQLQARSEVNLSEAMRSLVDAAHVAKAIRADLCFEDIVRMMAGICRDNDQPGWEASARRLLEIMMTGLRQQRSRSPRNVTS